MSKYALGLTDRIRQCKASDLERIKELQFERDTVLFLGFLLEVHSQARIDIFIRQHRRQSHLLHEKPPEPSKLF